MDGLMSTIDSEERLEPTPDGKAYAAIGAAIDYLVENYQDQPSLDDLAAAVGLSPFHFQRTFRHWAGISPKRFGQFLTVSHAKRLLDERSSLLDAAYEVGLSGPSRLHDLFVACEAMTPGEYKDGGRDLAIRWGVHDSPFGRLVIGETDKGVCWLSFVVGNDEEAFADELYLNWPGAELVRDDAGTAPSAEKAVIAALRETPPGEPLRLVLRGTNFQVKVWEALLRIPPGTLVSYQDVARAIGRPDALRAVGRAIGHNPISLIIPCHRVIQKSGVIHNYRWGTARKRLILGYEAARREAADAMA